MGVYILHFAQKFGNEAPPQKRRQLAMELQKEVPAKKRPYKGAHAEHYSGATKENTVEAVLSRIEAHYKGRGASLVAAVRDAGIDFAVAAVWIEESFEMEGAIKRRKNNRHFCPICQSEHEFIPFTPEAGRELILSAVQDTARSE